MFSSKQLLLHVALLSFVFSFGHTTEAPAAAEAGNDDALPDEIDAFEDEKWEVPENLIQVDLNNFERTVQGHELSVMVFFTKFAPYHRYAQRVLSSVAEKFEQQNKNNGNPVAFCLVDLDETPELSTYSHFNSIDVMYFYKHLILNGVRFPGTLVEDELLNYTHYMHRRTTVELQKYIHSPVKDKDVERVVKFFANPSADSDMSQFDAEAILDRVRIQAAVLDALVAIEKDSGHLAKSSNTHAQTVLRFNGLDARAGNTDAFLESRRQNEVFSTFLGHLYERSEVPVQASQKATPLHSEEAGRRKKEQNMVPEEKEEVLF